MEREGAASKEKWREGMQARAGVCVRHTRARAGIRLHANHCCPLTIAPIPVLQCLPPHQLLRLLSPLAHNPLHTVNVCV